MKFHLVSYAALAALTFGAAYADTDAFDAAATVETVVVTAQKREQNPIEVPMAITAYNGDFLGKAGIQEFDKLSLLVPGFVVQNQSPNNPGFGLRGLTLDSGDATQEPRVSVFEDDVSISTTRATYIELFDIERVEVAKGPQTTLFGRAALMGGVNVIQNKAKIDEYEGSAGFEFGDYGYHMIEGMANIPLTDDLSVRVSGRYKDRDGYVKNLSGGQDYNSVNTGAARLALAWKPTEALSLDLIFNFEQDAPSGTAFKSGTFAPSSATTGAILGGLDHTTGATLTDTVAGFENGKKLGLNRQVWDGKALVKYALADGLSLSSVTAYRRFDSEEVFDPDGFSKPVLQAAEDERGDQFSHEMRVNYDKGGLLSGFAGVDYFYSNVSQRVPMQFDEYGALSLLTWGKSTGATKAAMFQLLQNTPTAYFDAAMRSYAPAIVAGLGVPTAYAGAVASHIKTDHWEESTNFGKTKAVDLYGDVTLRPVDGLELEAGLRYTHDDKQSAFAAKIADRSTLGSLLALPKLPAASQYAVLASLAATSQLGSTPDATRDWGIMLQPTANNGDKISKDFTDDGLSWRFAARYALADESSLYATYARGRRPEVLSASSPSTPYGAPSFTPVPAETVDSYEIGYKTLTLNGSLRADIALYFYDYTNFQTTVLENNTFVTSNAGKAEAYGLETTEDWAFASWGDLFVTYTYNRARFVGDTVYRGNQFRLNPDHKASVGANLHQTFWGGTFTLMPTYTWQSKIYFDDDNDKPALQTSHFLPDTKVDEFQKQYGLFNLRLSYQPTGTNVTLGVFATNVFNQKFIKDAGNSGDNLGIPTFIAGEPRFIGGNISFKFR